MTKSRYNPTKKALLFWTLFIGIGAIFGGACMLIDPSGKLMGMDAMLPYFKKLPFSDILFTNFIFSGISLLIVNGLTNIIASILIVMNKKLGITLGGIFGITLMLWICIQFYMFPLNFMSTIYFIFGFIQAITGFMASVFYKQEHFIMNESDYPNIGTNKKLLVVWFSRMGYTKKIAYELANKTGACLYEVKSTEKIEGTLGFWWCGRYGMHKWKMPIEDIKVNLEEFDHVTICTPIWVFGLSAVMRSFCSLSKGKIKEADYVLLHFTRTAYFKVGKEMDDLLGLQNSKITSICSRYGKRLNKKIMNEKTYQ